MVARERDGLLAQPFGHNDGRAVGQRADGLGPGSDHDAGRRRAQGSEVELIVGARDHVLPDERIVPRAVVRGRQTEHRGVGGRPVGVIGGDRTGEAHERDELRHRRTKAGAQICFVDVDARGQRRPAIGEHLGRRRLVRDESADLLRMFGHES